MFKGVLYDYVKDPTTVVPALFSRVYFIAMRGLTWASTFAGRYTPTDPQKRGMIFQVYMPTDPSANLYTLPSKVWEFLQNQKRSDWDGATLAPILIDINYVPDPLLKMDLDALAILAGYFDEYIKPVRKPLLRFNVATWKSWYESNPEVALRLLRTFDPLVVNWGQPKPGMLLGRDTREEWFEYDNAMIAQDPTKAWIESPLAPAPVVPTPDPVVPDEPVTGEVTIAGKKIKITMLLEVVE